MLSPMDRKQFPLLNDWLAKPDRKPLILRGARQVGKSTLVRLFAERSRRPLAEVNLERHPDLAGAFARNDPAWLLNVLEALPGIGPIGPDGLLFLDEIQSVPEAISRAPLLAGGHAPSARAGRPDRCSTSPSRTTASPCRWVGWRTCTSGP